MSTVTETVRETALLVELEPHSVWVIAPLRETAVIIEATTPVPVAWLAEVAQLNDAYYEDVSSLLIDEALISSTAYPHLIRVRSLREVALLKTRVRAGVRSENILSEIALVADTVVSNTDVALRDTAKLNDIILPSFKIRRSLKETAKLYSRVRAAAYTNVSETATVLGTATTRLHVRINNREVALLSTLVHPDVSYRNILREKARVSDSLSMTLQSGGVLLDRAYIYGSATPPSYGRAYTCSIVTWGMSTFSNYAFTTIAGKYGSGNNLWKLDAINDAGTPIDSHILMGVKDMGAAQMKRVSALYAAGYSDAPLNVTVTADLNGQKESYDYDLELRDQSDYRNNRTLIGKGLRGRYVQFKIGATDVKYKLLAADIDIAVSQRRV
jgi:hypothetical protein